MKSLFQSFQHDSFYSWVEKPGACSVWVNYIVYRIVWNIEIHWVIDIMLVKSWGCHIELMLVNENNLICQFGRYIIIRN